MPWLAGCPRGHVEWYPTVSPDKCVKRGISMNCGKGVYDWTEAGARVARPYDCVVGCNTCANLCLGEAIFFPNIASMRALYEREGIWVKVKRRLEEEGKLATVELRCVTSAAGDQRPHFRLRSLGGVAQLRNRWLRSDCRPAVNRSVQAVENPRVRLWKHCPGGGYATMCSSRS